MDGSRPTRRPDGGLRPGLGPVVAFLALALTTAPALAQTDDSLHGRAELQDAGQFAPSDSLQAALGEADANDALGNLRLTWEPTWRAWGLQLHYVISAEDGPGVELARLESGVIKAPPPTWFDLTDTFENRGRLIASQTVDRLAVTYTTPEWVVRVGRQAITWGSGLVFRPMDLFDPFSPTATDTEYKPGVDMVYVQRLFPDGSDLQLILAPRPAHFGGPPTADDSSEALHYHGDVAGHPITLLLARDHGDWVAGAGVNGALGGATWNLELVPTFERDGRTRLSGVANISDALTLVGRSATVFAEYYRNGFGVVGQPLDLARLPPDLVDRLARGQVFSLRRDYLASGLTLQVSPLVNVSPTLLANLDDGGIFLLVATTWSLGDNLALTAGVQAPVAGPGAEYNGAALLPSDQRRLAPARQVYLQLRRYF